MTNDEKKFVELNNNDYNNNNNIYGNISSNIGDTDENQYVKDENTSSINNQNVNNASSLDSSSKDKTDSNCLSLTIVDDCHHLIKKNTLIKAIRMFFKVTVSTAILNFIKFFL